MSDAAARIDALIGVGRHGDATELARAELATSPGDVEILLRLARLDGIAGRWNDQLKHAEAAMAADPTREWAHRVRAQALWGKGWLADAELAARACPRLEPDEPLAYIMLLGILIAKNDLDEARTVLDRALEIGPDHPLILLRASRLEFADGVYEQAASYALRGLASNPDKAYLHLAAGEAFEKMKRIDEAAEHYVAAGKADPRSEVPKSRLRRLVGYVGLGAGGMAFAMFWGIREGLKEGISGWSDLGIGTLYEAAAFLVAGAAAVAIGLFIAYRWAVPFMMWAIQPLLRREALRRARKLPPEARRIIEADLRSEKRRRRARSE